jgi:2-(1,2-epoxy-1,2-dihydrophenyl)acetyl-CoA isomerase
MDEAGRLVLLEFDPPVATLTLNRAERHNSLVPSLLEEFLAGLEAIRQQENVRAVILQAQGRSFSTGGDLRAFTEHLGEIESYADRIVGLLNQVLLAMLELPATIVTAVNGIITGGSFGLVLASDIVLVAPQASFTPFYSVVGFSPDGGWTAILPEIIGSKKTMEILAENQTISAQQAVDWGLVDRLVPSECLREEALRVTREVASMPPGSIQCAKRLLSGRTPDIAERLEAERIRFVKQIANPETQRSMSAFLEHL